MRVTLLSIFIKAFTLVFCVGLSPFTYPVEKLPVEAFSNLPAIESVHLSPDGDRFAVLYNKDGYSLLLGREVNGKKMIPLVRTDNSKYKIYWVEWANNDVLAIGIKYPWERYGIETMETRLMKVSFTGGDFTAAVRSRKASQQGRGGFGTVEHDAQIQDNVIDWLPNDPEHFLLAADFERPGTKSIYKVSLTGGRKTIERPKRDVAQWITDHEHRPRVYVSSEGVHNEVVIYDLETKKWKSTWKFDDYSEDVVWPLDFGTNPNELYIRAYHNDKLAIFKVDLSSPDLNRELVFSKEHNDVSSNLLKSPKSGEVIGVVSDEAYEIWDESYEPFIKGLSKALSGKDIYFTDISRSEKQYVVYAESDIFPGTYYFGDRDKKRLFPVAHQYPRLKPSLMAEKKKIEYESRDGTKIEGYLTIPKGSEGKNLSTVVYPHGGPIARNTGGFDYWTQFFANRGYAVLQMNFRGSYGYGFDFMDAGISDWGLQMQRDIADGVNWLVDNGIADKNKICIAGGSFGGYSAMMSLAKEPDMFKCGIAFAGVYDLEKFIAFKGYFGSGKSWKKQIGKSGVELQDASPINFVNDIKAPVLLMHGNKDRVVRDEQSKVMARALRKAKKEYEYISLKDGTHHLEIQANRATFFKEIDKFLAKHLPVD